MLQTLGWLAAAGVAAAGIAIADTLGSPRHETGSVHGTARWATGRDLRRAGFFAPTGLLLGRGPRGLLLRSASDAHMLTVAPTRSGKGVAAVIPNLLTYPGSVVVVDPKGENAMVTARARAAMGQRVLVADPWGLTGRDLARFNPVAWLDPSSPDLSDDAALLAEALVPEEAHAGSRFWTDEARAWIATLLLYIRCCQPAPLQDLARLRELLTLGPDASEMLLEEMLASSAAEGLVARGAARMASKADKERSGVASTAQSHTHFLDSARMKAVTGGSDWQPADLKTRPTTLYLVLPADRLATHGRWLRLMVSLLLAEMARVPTRPEHPVLFLLDEFAALGRLQTVETAMGLMAGFGVQLWPVLQDFSQLRATYGDRWQTFVANAGLLQSFAVNDTMSARELSTMLGSRGAWARSSSRTGDSRTTSLTIQGRPLLFPDEVMRLPATTTLLLPRGLPPVRAQKLCYWRDRTLAPLADPNPYIAGMPLRSIGAPIEELPGERGRSLPAPTGTILAFAQRGLERELRSRGDLTPGSIRWAPLLADVLDGDDWQTRLQDLVLAGMHDARMSDHAALIEPALSVPGYRNALRRGLDTWL